MNPGDLERPVWLSDLQYVILRQLCNKSASGTEQLQGQRLLPVSAASTNTRKMHERLGVVRLARQYQIGGLAARQSRPSLVSVTTTAPFATLDTRLEKIATKGQPGLEGAFSECSACQWRKVHGAWQLPSVGSCQQSSQAVACYVSTIWLTITAILWESCVRWQPASTSHVLSRDFGRHRLWRPLDCCERLSCQPCPGMTYDIVPPLGAEHRMTGILQDSRAQGAKRAIAGVTGHHLSRSAVEIFHVRKATHEIDPTPSVWISADIRKPAWQPYKHFERANEACFVCPSILCRALVVTFAQWVTLFDQPQMFGVLFIELKDAIQESPVFACHAQLVTSGQPFVHCMHLKMGALLLGLTSVTSIEDNIKSCDRGKIGWNSQVETAHAA